MKLIISIGPDTRGTRKYKSKKTARAALDRLLKKEMPRPDHCGLRFMDRKYTQYEVREANIYTLSEFFKVLE